MLFIVFLLVLLVAVFFIPPQNPREEVFAPSRGNICEDRVHGEPVIPTGARGLAKQKKQVTFSDTRTERTFDKKTRKILVKHRTGKT